MYDIQERIEVLTRFCPRCINTPDLPLRYERRVMAAWHDRIACLLYTSPSPRDGLLSRMPSSA